MKPSKKSKSRQVIEYLYQYSIQKGTTELIETIVPYGKIGMILWEVGQDIYEIMYNSSDDECETIINEMHQISEQEIESLSIELSKDPSIIYPIDLLESEKKEIANKICQTFKQMSTNRDNPQNLINSLNKSLFHGNHVLSMSNVHVNYQNKAVGSAVLKFVANHYNDNQQPRYELPKFPEIDGFEIKGILGKGSYATVYLANETKGKKRTCALKVGVIENTKRLDNEVNTLNNVNHPHVINSWDTGIINDQGIPKYWISMPNMGKMTLEHLILAKSLDLEEKLMILMQIVDGLAALHEKGILHRDLKPSNCLISSDFELKISDFGLSKNINSKIQSTQSRDADAIGTPAYMSPEQIEGEFGFYSDVWAFGMIAFELFKEDLPWGRNIKPLVLIGNIQHRPIDVKQLLAPLNLPTFLIEIISQCLQQDYKLRFKDGIELKNKFYPLAKAERNRIREPRFKESWKTIKDKKLIHQFIIDQIDTGNSQFDLKTFLNISTVIPLYLNLDIEKLDEIFNKLSKLSAKLNLEKLINDHLYLQKQINQIDQELHDSITRIDHETAEILNKLPAMDIAKQLPKITTEIRIKKMEIERSLAYLKKSLISEMETLKREIEKHKQVILNQLSILIDPPPPPPKTQSNHSFKRMTILLLLIVAALYVQDHPESWTFLKHQLDQAIKYIQDMQVQAPVVQIQDMQVQAPVVQIQDMQVQAPVVQIQDMQVQAPVVQIQDMMIKINPKPEIQWIHLKGGGFWMGNSDFSYEKPLHYVTTNDFHISKTEVTVGQYQKCIDAGVCSQPHWNDGTCWDWNSSQNNWEKKVIGIEFRGENQPVICVDWMQARTFAKWIGGDLPSEAQWEYAFKSEGRYDKYPWGDEYPTCEYAVISNGTWGCGERKTWNVCSKNLGNTKQGVCDMAGNVWEWVLDQWHDSYQDAPKNDKAWCNHNGCDDANSHYHVIRGAGWYSEMKQNPVIRAYEIKSISYVATGFRIVK